MNLAERQRLYKETISKLPDVTPQTRTADAFGFSNSAKIVERGLFAFNANFNALAVTADQLVVHCLLRFPPEDEVYFSIFVKTELGTLRQRLEDMRSTGTSRPRGSGSAEEREGEEEEPAETPASSASPDGLSYTDNSKNVKGYIGLDGRLYLRNKGFWDTMPVDLSTISRPVTIDRIVFGIWPPAISARRSLLAREFVGYLGNLIGPEKIYEVQVWTEETALNPAMRRMPATIPLPDIERAVADLGGHYPDGEVRRYHAALNFLTDKHFVILAGLSGTGKTRLALNYARAIHGITAPDGPDPLLFVCPVRPEWTDPAGLTGYPDVLSGQYIVPPFLEAVLVATAHRDSPVFVVLDELNLARVEYYFSDVLSCIETGEPLQLHSNSVPLKGSNGTPVRAAIPIPPNLFITGTINVDETTNPVSDKVLDRAVVIDMSKVDLEGFLTGLVGRHPTLGASYAVAGPVLLAVQNALTDHNLGFGYRVAQEVLRYHAFAGKHAGGAGDALDDLMVQKVLVKLRGGERQRTLLTGLKKALTGLSRSQKMLDRLIYDLDEFGSFQATR